MCSIDVHCQVLKITSNFYFFREKRLAKKYYDKLFKEYCISDLSRYKENKVALRWRIEKEVIEGKGQFMCGDKRCTESEGLRSWEVNFAYVEHGEKKNTLIKLRLCPDCSYKLNYHHKKKLAKQKKKEKKTSKKSNSSKKKQKKEKHHRNNDKNSSSSAEDSEDDDHNIEESNAAASGSSKSVDHSKSTCSGEDIWKGPAKVTVDKTRSNDNNSSSSAEDSEDNDHNIEESNAATSGSSKGVDHSKSSCSGEDIWKGPAKVTVDKTREEEFEEYFQDMFL
ncbi:protein FRA10AC1 homolog [Orbicella faveolata]|uniref:protein FRA10AC1 homolog n=1 Tax=Orbicella faveolata TaxID=48498 RepID=UPI0009E3C5BF|nr:protein FRA10AC1 homolog [Orbicella faveolata]